MIKKKQVYQGVNSAQNQKEFIHNLFGLALQASNLKEMETLCF